METPIQNSFILAAMLAFMLPAMVDCRIGASLYPPSLTASNIKCMMNSGYNQISFIGYDQTERPFYCNGDLFTAEYVGIEANLIFRPCRSSSVDDQVRDFFREYQSSMYNSIFIEVLPVSKQQCNWTNYSPQSNCDFLYSLYSRLRDMGKGKSVGVMTSNTNWSQIMAYQCNFGNPGIPLWNINPDGIPDINSGFTSFGGWSSATRKQFGNNNVCGYYVGMNSMY